MHYTPYSIPLFFSAVMMFGLALYAWHNRGESTAVSFGFAMLFAGIWAFSQGMDMSVLDQSRKLFWLKVRSPAIECLNISLFIMAVEYTGQGTWLKPARLAAILAVPFTTVLVVWSGRFHYLFRYDYRVDASGPFPVLLFTNGPWFWVHAAYCYCLGATALLLLGRSLVSARPLYYRRTLIIMITMLLPITAETLFLFGITPVRGFDPASSTFIFTGPLIAWTLFGFRLFDIVPIARTLVVEKITDSILVLDRYDRIVDLNHAAQTTLKLDPATIIGKSAPDALGPWNCIISPYPEMQPGRKEISVNVQGEEKQYDVSISPVTGPRNRLLGRLVLLHDITELKRSQRAVEEATRAKSAFLANTSHEIRTPLNAILGFTDLLLDTGLTAEQRTYLEIVKASSDSLLVILNDIMDASKIEAGKMELEEVDFDLAALIDATVRSLSLQAETKQIKLEHHIDPDVPRQIKGDPIRLKQVLLNLVGNAIKFTEQGGVHLGIQRVRTEKEARPADPALLFCVHDTGIGIREDRQKTIFQSFTQADNTITRKYGGTGLGLTIASELVRLMGGELKVESSPGKGSTFYFTARFKPGAATEALLFRTALPPARRRMNILVVDDTEVSRTLTVRMLEKRGHSVTTARNGKEAIHLLGTARFDLVLLDDRMPRMDGCETANAIRDGDSRVLRHDVPIVALSAYAMPSESERCLKAGMNEYLSKPIRPEELIAAVERYMPAPGRSPAPESESPGPLPGPEPSGNTAGPASDISAAGIEAGIRASILRRYSDDAMLAEELLRVFREEIPGIAHRIGQAIHARDVLKLELHAHSCKSAAGTVGFDVLERIAYEIEKAAKAGGIDAAGVHYEYLKEELQKFLNEF